jgi:hypothetical protein
MPTALSGALRVVQVLSSGSLNAVDATRRCLYRDRQRGSSYAYSEMHKLFLMLDLGFQGTRAKTDMNSMEVIFCNQTYSEQWFKDIKTSNPQQLAVIEAITEAINLNGGRDIDQAEIFARHPNVAKYVMKHRYRIIPANGQLLKHNGRGIRHAKYSPSKSVAILWETIRETIYVTFDDHAPVRYHRAIHYLSELRLGRKRLPLKSRNSRKFMNLLAAKYKRKSRGINFRNRHYI